jgi:hypothetical protein
MLQVLFHSLAIHANRIAVLHGLRFLLQHAPCGDTNKLRSFIYLFCHFIG